MKTPKGTTLPLMNIKGKDYLQVAYRLVWFREEHPDWRIETEILSPLDGQVSVARATIKNADGVILAVAHKKEDVKGFADHLEKAETGAIGRALAMCGYGTQFAPEFDEEERLADAPVERAAPAAKITAAPVIKKAPLDESLTSLSQFVIKFGQYRNKKLSEVEPAKLDSYINWLEDNERKTGKPSDGVVRDFIDAATAYLFACGEMKEGA